MATLYTHKDSNIRKTWALMGVFLVLIIGLGWFFGYVLNEPIILYVAVFFALVMNIVSYWYSDKIAIALAGAVLADESEYQELYRIVENLSITAGLPMPKVYIINDPAPNAFATGRDPAHAVIAVTTGLLRILDKNEIEGVISHELSHVGNRDILVSTVAVVLAGFIAILSNFFLRSRMFSGGSDRGGGQVRGVLMIVGLALAILAPIAGTLMQLAISRKREFLADASGALLTRYPEGLASALEKISANGAPLARANSATAHLFISNPFGSHPKRFLANLFQTHPPIEERIKALRNP